MAKKSTKSTETAEIDPIVPPATEPEAAVKPKKKRATKKVKIEDPIGDVSDGEAKAAVEPVNAPAADGEIATAEDHAETEAEGGAITSPETDATADTEASPAVEADDDEDEPVFKPRPPAKLERLQKILAKAGVASRRKAEEMIEQGRVQVNGKTVTELGTKADSGRDHIRVDGKLLQGDERLRYFVLNKPRGFVTTVKDPEGRPTVMQFFDKMRERLYPVGRLDYMSEGLLLVTNDGELANRLTRASAGVEKTYLVKVAGIPTEDELDLLRGGVSIERGKPGSAKVRTSPARIRQVRQGDNPWYEVVLIEGRNRELRKMFEEVGHFVEKIRRVGYGPLVLDQEPGNLRELDADELEQLRKAADGKLRTPKSKDVRRRNLIDAGQLPTVSPRFSSPRPAKPYASKSFDERPAAGPKDYKPKRAFETGQPARPGGKDSRTGGSEFRPSRPAGEAYRPNVRPSARPAWQKDDRPSRPEQPTRSQPRFEAGTSGESGPPATRPYAAKPFGAKPFAKKPIGAKPFESRPAAGRSFPNKPPADGNYPPRAAAGKAFGDKPAAGRSFPAKPAWKKPEGQQWPPYKRPPSDRVARPAAPRREFQDRDEDLGPVRPPNLHIEEISASERPSSSRPSRPAQSRPSAPRSYGDSPKAPYARPDRPSPARGGSDRPDSGRPGSGRPSSGGSYAGRPSGDRSAPSRSSSARPPRSEGGGLARPFTTSSGKPRPGGARPSSKPGRSYGSGSGAPRSGPRTGAGSRPSTGSRTFTPREGGTSDYRPTQAKPYPDSSSRAERKAGPGWKPKPSFGGPPRPGSNSRSKPKPGSSGKSGYKGKPSGPKRSGASGGKKRR